jgi:aconitate hydratase
MGVLPLQFKDGQSVASLGLTGHETYTIQVDDDLQPLQGIQVDVTDIEGRTRTIAMTCRVDTPVEVDYYRNGGILQTVLRSFL